MHDLVTGLISLMDSSYADTPVNIGSSDEGTVLSWAEAILSLVRDLRAAGQISPLPSGRGESAIEFLPEVVDDPPRRRPDTTLARETIAWEPKWTVQAGLEETIRYFAALLAE